MEKQVTIMLSEEDILELEQMGLITKVEEE